DPLRQLIDFLFQTVWQKHKTPKCTILGSCAVMNLPEAYFNIFLSLVINILLHTGSPVDDVVFSILT
nr:hypothetical protein [Chlamydiota bacterium]